MASELDITTEYELTDITDDELVIEVTQDVPVDENVDGAELSGSMNRLFGFSRWGDAVEECPVGSAGVEQGADPVVPEVLHPEGHPHPRSRILEIIREVGLAPTKARNLWVAANQIVDAGGELLADWAFLESLAGVGHKTASVVMAQAFGVPAFPVDTHIHRLAARWGLSSGTTVERAERDLKAVFPKDRWIDRHLQMIYFGREYCPAQRHDMAACPICPFAATKQGIAAEARSRRPPGTLRPVRAAD